MPDSLNRVSDGWAPQSDASGLPSGSRPAAQSDELPLGGAFAFACRRVSHPSKWSARDGLVWRWVGCPRGVAAFHEIEGV